MPGVPDLYQGCEFWDLSLVDPDNRRPVDYAARRRALAKETPVEALLARWRDGRVKQFVIARTLAFRRARPDLFSRGEYLPLMAGTERVVAFARRLGEDACLVAAPRLCAAEIDPGLTLSAGFRADAGLASPELAGRSWRDAFTGREVSTGDDGSLSGEGLFGGFPLALLVPK
jgi:(1->4)-alpha-D-glucan 1-alpha-D-glucosylmutase